MARMDGAAAITPELVDVRADERFDEERLAGHLRGRLPGSEAPLPCASSPGARPT